MHGKAYKLTKAAARTVTERMLNALNVACDKHDGRWVSEVSAKGYVSWHGHAHTFEIARRIVTRPRNGFFLLVHNRSTVSHACHTANVFEFPDRQRMCAAYDYLFAARKNA